MCSIDVRSAVHPITPVAGAHALTSLYRPVKGNLEMRWERGEREASCVKREAPYVGE